MIEDREIKRVFQTNEEYFTMMQTFHEHCEDKTIPVMLEYLVGEELRKVTDGWFLDAGCGEGSIAIYFAEKHVKTKCIGVDISPIGTRLGQKKAGGLSVRNVNFVVDDLESLSIKGRSVNVVYCQSVLEHVTDWEKAIEEFHRILTPGGVLFIEVGNGGWRGSFAGFYLSTLKYLLGINRARRLDSGFCLSGADEEREQSHKTEFDVWEIPSDVLLKILKIQGFNIEYFSTNREHLCNRNRYLEANFLYKTLVAILVWLPFFPFTHIGGQIILKARKPL